MRCSLLVLSTYLDGELEADRRNELEAHLVGCPRCRSGLGYLGEEVERISALACAHVPDHSVNALFQELGLLEVDEPVSDRSTPVDVEGASSEAPWLTPRSARRILPWSARAARPARPSVPETVLSVAAPFTERAVNPSAIEDGPSPDAPGSPGTAGEQASPDPPPAGAGGGSRAGPDGATPGAAGPDPASAPGAPAVDPDPCVPPGGRPVHPTMSSADAPPQAGAHEPHVGGSPPVPPMSTEFTPGDEPAADGPGHGDVEHDLIGGPRLAEQPATVIGRLRDRLSTYRALARGTRGDEYDDSVQIVSGAGAPPRAARRGSTYSHSLQAAAGPHGHTYEPASAPPRSSVLTGHVEMEADPSAAEEDGFLFPPLAEPPLPGDGDPAAFAAFSGRLGPIPGYAPEGAAPLHGEVVSPRAPARPVTRGGDDASAFDHVTTRPRGAARARTPDRRPREAPLAARVRTARDIAVERWQLGIFGVVVIALMAAGIATGRTTGPAPSVADPVSPRSPATVARPAVPAPVVPAPPAALTGEQGLGSGGTGYQVKAIRYGAHPGDFRIVFDLADAGAATGTPTTVIGWSSPTTLQVRLASVLAAGSIGPLPTGDPVAGVSLVQPSPVAGAIVYQFTVTRPVTFTGAYTQGPLRLVLDLH